MLIEKGSVVKSRAGRDKDCFLAVLEVQGVYCMLVDGKSRKLIRPKKKKLIHLQVTCSKLSEESFSSDHKLREALRDFDG